MCASQLVASECSVAAWSVAVCSLADGWWQRGWWRWWRRWCHVWVCDAMSKPVMETSPSLSSCWMVGFCMANATTRPPGRISGWSFSSWHFCLYLAGRTGRDGLVTAPPLFPSWLQRASDTLLQLLQLLLLLLLLYLLWGWNCCMRHCSCCCSCCCLLASSCCCCNCPC